MRELPHLQQLIRLRLRQLAMAAPENVWPRRPEGTPLPFCGSLTWLVCRNSHTSLCTEVPTKRPLRICVPISLGCLVLLSAERVEGFGDQLRGTCQTRAPIFDCPSRRVELEEVPHPSKPATHAPDRKGDERDIELDNAQLLRIHPLRCQLVHLRGDTSIHNSYPTPSRFLLIAISPNPSFSRLLTFSHLLTTSSYDSPTQRHRLSFISFSLPFPSKFPVYKTPTIFLLKTAHCMVPPFPSLALENLHLQNSSY